MKQLRLKPLHAQVIVITGASSGIGLTTAKMAAAGGAKVVLAARDEPSLRQAVDEIQAKGGRAIYMVADVAEPSAARQIADAARREFGGFDTWINNAGVLMFGLATEVPLEDARRLFDVNYWGVVQGSLTAVEYLREHGGALINIGSIDSDRSMPLQSHYSASKQAVKGFTDALRMELEKEGVPVSVSLIKPASIATPMPQHAKNYMAVEPTLPPPVYAPAVVAETILQCAQRPVRDVIVGGGGRLFSSLGYLLPRLMDRLMEARLFDQQKAGPRQRPSEETNLYAPVRGSDRERGEINRHVMQSSLYTRAALHPMLTLTGLVALTLGVVWILRSRS
ncbi:MAG: SDR family oxidoreductase [Candidatus Competibacteraceae bacterium]